LSDDVGHISGIAGTELPIENGCDLAVSDQTLAHIFMFSHRPVELFADRFKRVAEHPVADIMKKRCGQSALRLVSPVLLIVRFDVISYHANQLTSRMKNTYAMREARMCRARKYELGESQLSDAAKTLERPRLDKFPKRVLKMA